MELTTKFGNKPKDQELIYTDRGMMFVSYGSNIALILNKDYKEQMLKGLIISKKELLKYRSNIILDECYWDYSATTGYYRNQFLGEGIAETKKNIKSGVYTLANLN